MHTKYFMLLSFWMFWFQTCAEGTSNKIGSESTTNDFLLGMSNITWGINVATQVGGKLPLPQMWSLMKGHQLVNFT
jgi:hypothetical protein